MPLRLRFSPLSAFPPSEPTSRWPRVLLIAPPDCPGMKWHNSAHLFSSDSMLSVPNAAETLSFFLFLYFEVVSSVLMHSGRSLINHFHVFVRRSCIVFSCSHLHCRDNYFLAHSSCRISRALA